MPWDDLIPHTYRKKWETWLEEWHLLDSLKIPRCYKRKDKAGSLKTTEVHHFTDASEEGYGTVSYVRYIYTNGDAHCGFLMAKTRVTPVKSITIPRLELTAAVTAVRVNAILEREIEIPVNAVHFWTDIQTVLRYIHNKKSRFHTFVANRIQTIHELSQPSQWHYVKSDLNPADEASRGLTMAELLQSERWFQGPQFLRTDQCEWPSWPENEEASDMPETDPEIKKAKDVKTAKCLAVKTTEDVKKERDTVKTLMTHYSTWDGLRRAVSWWLRWKQFLINRAKNREITKEPEYLLVEEVKKAEETIISVVQQEAFPVEYEALKKSKPIPKNSTILNLDPILRNGVLRVGGRLRNAPISEDSKHQMILPKHHHISDLIIRHVHQQCNHQGQNHMIATLRQKYWIVGAGVRVKSIVKKCVVCRKHRSPVITQKMADLPENRVKPDEPPFMTTGMDYFGPFGIKQGRVTRKRYGVIFTCMVSRAVHIEVADSLDTSSCINAIRRFVCRRGEIKEIVSDNGTNMVGANKELSQSIKQLNKEAIQRFGNSLQINWKFNPPGASHHGGAWERHIRTIRKILQSMLAEQHLKAARNDDQLHTLMCEIEATINSRPLTKISEDPADLSVLTPNHLLQMKNPAFFPPGVFCEKDLYSKRRWRQVQFLADLFWKRWTAEYLPLLQKRQKWLQPTRNVQVGDLVLIVDSTAPRNSWLMGLVQDTRVDQNGFVRSAEVKTRTSVLTRPITKLCLLLEQDDPQ